MTTWGPMIYSSPHLKDGWSWLQSVFHYKERGCGFFFLCYCIIFVTVYKKVKKTEDLATRLSVSLNRNVDSDPVPVQLLSGVSTSLQIILDQPPASCACVTRKCLRFWYVEEEEIQHYRVSILFMKSRLPLPIYNLKASFTPVCFAIKRTSNTNLACGAIITPTQSHAKTHG